MSPPQDLGRVPAMRHYGRQASNGTTTTGFPTSNSTVTFTATPEPSSSISSGAVAGIAIGTFIIGALIGLLAVCIFMRRSKRSTQPPIFSPSAGPVYSDKGIYSQTLLEPASDSEIKQDMLLLGTHIEQHVDNNYHLNAASGNATGLSNALSAIGYYGGLGISADQLASLLLNPQSRHSAIRHLISWKIFSSISPNSPAEVSLLPPQIAAFLAAFPPVERTSGAKQAYDHHLSVWRTTSSYLLQTMRTNRAALLPNEASLKQAISTNIAQLQQVLRLFVNPSGVQAQERNLGAILSEGARFGLLLFSQPTTWAFEWDVERVGRQAGVKTQGREGLGRAVVFPGLTKVGGKDGVALQEKKIVAEVETVDL